MTSKNSETVDMSARAIAARLDKVRSLYLLCRSLRQAAIAAPMEPASKSR
jgi:hypothetical protein